MRRKYKNFISTIICASLLFAIVLYASNFLRKEISYVKNADFYNQEEDFDVLFLGSSHMIMGISPMELWGTYGIMSYNLANHGQWIPVDYWVLKNALDYTKPKLIVADVYAISMSEKYSANHISYMHEVFDIMPISGNKVSAVYDLLPKGKRMEFLYDFSYYHTRWNEVDSTFWDKSSPSTQKGANLDNSNSSHQAIVSEIEPIEIIDKNRMCMDESTGKKYLRKIIELCQKEHIEVLLTSLPCVAPDLAQEWYNSAEAIADECGIEYLDWNREDTVINYNTDFYDAGHLNSSGAKKITEELGAYLVKNYDLTDWRESDIAPEWEQDYIEYINYKQDWLKAQSNLDTYLMCLADKQFSAVVEIHNPNVWYNSSYVHLFENLGVDLSKITDNTDCLVIQEGGKCVDVLEGFFSSDGRYETAIGQLRLQFCNPTKESDDSDRSYSVFLDNKEQYSVTPEEKASIRILVINKDTLEIVDYTAF